MWFSTIDDDDTISEKEGIAAVDHYLKAETEYDLRHLTITSTQLDS
jgi:hypothetical protein